jgi:hypothetical protein
MLPRFKPASEKLNEVWQAVSAELYKAASEKPRGKQAAWAGQAARGRWRADR